MHISASKMMRTKIINRDINSIIGSLDSCIDYDI